MNAGEVITVHGADITARDNVDLAESGGKIGPLFEGLYQAGLIDAREYLRVVYRFVGEEVDLDALLERAGTPETPGKERESE